MVSSVPQETPIYVLHYSSLTCPSSGLNLYFVCHNKSSLQVTRNLIAWGNFRRIGALFRFIARIHRAFKSLQIRGQIFVKFAKVQDLGGGFGAPVNQWRAISRKYGQWQVARPRSGIHEIAFSENQSRRTIMISLDRCFIQYHNSTIELK